MNRNPEMASPPTDMERARGIQPETYAVIKALNERATALSDAIDEFGRLARDRMRVALGEAREEEAKPDPRAAKAELLGLPQGRCRWNWATKVTLNVRKPFIGRSVLGIGLILKTA
jgi:hypothetical protein